MHVTLLRNIATLASQQARLTVMQLARQFLGAFASLTLGWNNIFARIIFDLGLSGLSQSPVLCNDIVHSKGSPASSIAVQIMTTVSKRLEAIVVSNVSWLQQQPIHVAPVQPDVLLLKKLIWQLALNCIHATPSGADKSQAKPSWANCR
jgi:hypothetical protein